MFIVDSLAKWFPDKGSIPNKFTTGMGNLIRQARLEAHMSEEELAELAYVSPATLVAFERGEKEPSSSELTYLAGALKKPIVYFFPDWLRQQLNPDYTTAEELEFLMLLPRLGKDDRRRLLACMRAWIDLDQESPPSV